MKNKKLSIVLITLNEAHNLERFFQCLLGWVDDIFVLDSFSSDETIDICKKYGATVYQRKFDNYGAQWNAALSIPEIKTDWVMKLDPDEVVTESLKKNINLALNQSAYDAFNIFGKLFFMGKPLPRKNKTLRIWRRGACSFSNSIVNEYPLINGLVGDINDYFEHHDSPDLNHWLNKQNKYTASEAESFVNNYDLPIKPRLFGDETERRMLAKKYFYFLPLRYVLLFLYHFIFLKAFLAGKVGFLWSRLRVLVYFLIDAKSYELKLLGRKKFLTYPTHPGKPDPRCKQI